MITRIFHAARAMKCNFSYVSVIQLVLKIIRKQRKMTQLIKSTEKERQRVALLTAHCYFFLQSVIHE